MSVITLHRELIKANIANSFDKAHRGKDKTKRKHRHGQISLDFDKVEKTKKEIEELVNELDSKKHLKTRLQQEGSGKSQKSRSLEKEIKEIETKIGKLKHGN